MAHDARTRKKAQVLYEAGKSPRFIEEKLGVAYNTLRAWAKEEKWVKGKIASKLRQAEESGAIIAAERAGLTNEHFFRGVRELVEASNVVTVGPTGMISQYAKPEYADITEDPQGLKTAEFLGTGHEVIPDRAFRKEGLKLMLESFPGLKVATQIEINPVAEILDKVRARHNK